MFEVEQKFALPVARRQAVQDELVALGAVFGSPIQQTDIYFAHPARNFVETDEALRIRCLQSETRITYKGPRLEGATKTRREIELLLGTADDTSADFTRLLEALGFKPSGTVVKTRRVGCLQWQDEKIEAALDDVTALGTFLELEITCLADQLETAGKAVLQLAEHLKLDHPERRSYLEMVLSQQASA